MLVADKYVVIHVSKQAGTSIERYLEAVDPSVRRVGEKHNWRSENSSTLPTIAVIRDPHQWYVSVYLQYKAVNHPLYEVIGGTFEEFTNTLLCMPKEVVGELESLDWSKTYPRKHSGLTSESFKDYDYGVGYYTWLWKKSHLTKNSKLLTINLDSIEQQLPRAIETLGIVVDRNIGVPRFNTNNDTVKPSYSKELQSLIQERDEYMINKYRSSL